MSGSPLWSETGAAAERAVAVRGSMGTKRVRAVREDASHSVILTITDDSVASMVGMTLKSVRKSVSRAVFK